MTRPFGVSRMSRSVTCPWIQIDVVERPHLSVEGLDVGAANIRLEPLPFLASGGAFVEDAGALQLLMPLFLPDHPDALRKAVVGRRRLAPVHEAAIVFGKNCPPLRWPAGLAFWTSIAVAHP